MNNKDTDPEDFLKIPEIEDFEIEIERPLVDQNLFCPISLGDWIEACENADVPFVPAERITEFNRQDMLMFDVEGEHHQRLLQSYEAIAEGNAPRAHDAFRLLLEHRGQIPSWARGFRMARRFQYIGSGRP